ncbi:hypothetical protein Pelo_18988 [Pelomyxa schiedti]|nr:hypothetical protein Pelo_18988 [Pelomyxa schiedti]
MALTVLLKGKPRTHGSTTGRILLLVTIAWFVITLLCSDYGVDPEHHGLYCCISLVVFFTLFSCGTSLVWMSVSSISSMLKTGCRALSAVFLATLCVVGVCITFTVLSSNHSWKIGIHGSTFASSWPGCSIPVPSISWFDLMPSSFIVWLLKSGQCKPFSPSLSAHFVNNSYIIGQCPTPGKVNFIVFPPTEDVPPSAVNLRKLGCIQKWVLEHTQWK